MEERRILSEEQETAGNYAITRRDLFKGAGIAGAALALSQLPPGRSKSPGIPVAEAAVANSIDELYEISPDLKQFDQKNEMYARVLWDSCPC